MTIYELNQGLYSNPNIVPMTSSNVRTVIKEYLENHLAKFYLMLNHDMHYYTVFYFEDKNRGVLNRCVQTIWNLVHDLGDVMDALINPDNGMLEFWIKRPDGQVLMFGFFEYERGVVKL